ncbi:MAG: hypothetical protein PHH04_04330 [Thomasclavelia sp.]|nr:hypothetical protein [Thomasclavelia sp.]
MKIKDLIKKFEDDDDDEEYHENIDPVLEQRRKEKFSAPFYNDEFEVVQEKIDAQQIDLQDEEVEHSIEEPTFTKIDSKEIKKPISKKPEEKEEKKAPAYRFSEVISPISGYNKTSTYKNNSTNRKTIVKKKYENSLVPVISPYYGNFDNEEIVETSSKLTNIKDVKVDDDIDSTKEIPTVEDNLRNISKLVSDEQDELKIIEERTGEFKLDINNKKDDTDKELIDEIDDNMTLDELMNLYEKKFKD